MKRFLSSLIIFLPLLSMAQVSPSSTKMTKLVIDSKKSYTFSKGDSSLSVVIDTLIMKDKSQLLFFGKKNVNLTVRYAEIGKDCILSGTDSKNNGTDLTLSFNFAELKSLYVDAAGRTAKSSNRKFDNGNGGKVVLNYLSAGKKPQTTDRKMPQYVSISTGGGGQTINPNIEIANVMGQMRNSGGRITGVPSGRVYSGGVGQNGKATISAIGSIN